MANTPRLDRLEKNYLINGGIDFSQRNLNTTVNLSGSILYYMDRWLARFTGTFSGTPTIRQEAVSPDSRAQFCMRFDGNASNSAASYEIRQRIESIHCLEMVADGSASFSAWIYSESATSADLRMFTANSQDNFGTVTSFPVGTISKTLTVGQWNLVKWENVAVPAAGANGIEFRIELNNMTVTGTSKIHRFTQLQAVAGSRAPNFERCSRTLHEEYMACLRYCWSVTSSSISWIGYGVMHSTTALSGAIRFPVAMRATPTCTAGGATTNWACTRAGSNNAGFSVLTLGLATPYSVKLVDSNDGAGTPCALASAATANAGCMFGPFGGLPGNFTADAEL